MSCECKYVLSSLRNALGRGCWPTFFPAQVEVAEEGHGASLTFLTGALSWLTPSSRTWGSFWGQQAGWHVQHLQSHNSSQGAVRQDAVCQGLWLGWDRHHHGNIHGRLAGWQAGEWGCPRNHHDPSGRMGCSGEKPGCCGTLLYSPRVLGSPSLSLFLVLQYGYS